MHEKCHLGVQHGLGVAHKVREMLGTARMGHGMGSNFKQLIMQANIHQKEPHYGNKKTMYPL